METFWKVNDVAARVRLSVSTIYRYVAAKEIPYHKLKGGAVRFKPSEIEAWIENRRADLAMTQNEKVEGGLFEEKKVMSSEQ